MINLDVYTIYAISIMARFIDFEMFSINTGLSGRFKCIFHAESGTSAVLRGVHLKLVIASSHSNQIALPFLGWPVSMSSADKIIMPPVIAVNHATLTAIIQSFLLMNPAALGITFSILSLTIIVMPVKVHTHPA